MTESDKIELDSASFIEKGRGKSVVCEFSLAGENVERFRLLSNGVDDDGDFKTFLEIVFNKFLQSRLKKIKDCL